jgi:hypothetical protein
MLATTRHIEQVVLTEEQLREMVDEAIARALSERIVSTQAIFRLTRNDRKTISGIRRELERMLEPYREDLGQVRQRCVRCSHHER